jgi:hypothetical protein
MYRKQKTHKKHIDHEIQDTWDLRLKITHKKHKTTNTLKIHHMKYTTYKTTKD